jgi:predicted DNA-binding ribbon-helix-helix protein
LSDNPAHGRRAGLMVMEGMSMCHFFASQSPESYAFETRSIRLNGQSTSIRLERMFWRVLERVAAREALSVPKFISTLHNEILIMRGEAANFTSHLRCVCIVAIEAGLLVPEADVPRAMTDHEFTKDYAACAA